jgi:hypothetical protein
MAVKSIVNIENSLKDQDFELKYYFELLPKRLKMNKGS